MYISNSNIVVFSIFAAVDVCSIKWKVKVVFFFDMIRLCDFFSRIVSFFPFWNDFNRNRKFFFVNSMDTWTFLSQVKLCVQICTISDWNCIKAKLNEFIGYFNICFLFFSFRLSSVLVDYGFGAMKFHKRNLFSLYSEIICSFYRLGVALCVSVFTVRCDTAQTIRTKTFFLEIYSLTLELHNALKAF